MLNDKRHTAMQVQPGIQASCTLVVASIAEFAYSVEQVAGILRCAVSTVEAHARSGHLPGLLMGDGGYVFPAGALFARLNEIALAEATERRAPSAPSGVLVPISGIKRRKRCAPALPVLVPSEAVGLRLDSGGSTS